MFNKKLALSQLRVGWFVSSRLNAPLSFPKNGGSLRLENCTPEWSPIGIRVLVSQRPCQGGYIGRSTFVIFGFSEERAVHLSARICVSSETFRMIEKTQFAAIANLERRLLSSRDTDIYKMIYETNHKSHIPYDK